MRDVDFISESRGAVGMCVVANDPRATRRTGSNDCNRDTTVLIHDSALGRIGALVLRIGHAITVVVHVGHHQIVHGWPTSQTCLAGGQNVEHVERFCRVTRMRRPEHLIVSQFKL